MLSKRGYQNSTSPVVGFHEKNTAEGVISFGNAENFLMHETLLEYIRKQDIPLGTQILTYGNGPIGTNRLRLAMATHLNEYFHPITKITADHITFAAGVTALNHFCALNLVEDGEAMLLGMPCYGAFNHDMTMGTGCKLIHTPFRDIDQFSPRAIEKYEEAPLKADKEGTKIKALIICNPHNPLGRCYPIETLKALFVFCQKYDIHLISDEIYALSVFEIPGDVQPTGFTSVLAVESRGLIDPGRIHVLYGMSKDFAAAGLRLGCLVTQYNESFSNATRALCRFSWPSEISCAIATHILEDREFVKSFLKESQRRLGENYSIATRILDDAKINYYRGGNAGLFLWIDLSPYLEPHLDSWEAESKLSKRINEVGVVMSMGASYHEEKAGWFRVIFSLEEGKLWEGLRRVLSAAVFG